MKTDLSTNIFSDACRATLDGPDGFAQRGNSQIIRLERQQYGVIFGASIVSSKTIDFLYIDDSVMINANNNSMAFFELHKLLLQSFKRNRRFLQHSARLSCPPHQKFKKQQINGISLIQYKMCGPLK